jgi:hypothetical protein
VALYHKEIIMTSYAILVGSGSSVPATSFVTKSSGSGTFVVPTAYNAIHIQAAVGGGGGAMREVQTMIKQVENQQVLVVDQELIYQIKFLV